MSAKEIHLDDSARRAFLTGVERHSTSVKTAFGPSGRGEIVAEKFTGTSTSGNAIIEPESDFKDLYENMGAQLVREVANKTSDTTGGGATTAVVLAESIYREGLEKMSSGADPTSLQNGINQAVEAITKELARLSAKVKGHTGIAQVATMAANGDSAIGEIIAEAMKKVGTNGTIIVGESKSFETSVAVVEGMQLSKGYLSPYFVTNPESMEAVLDNAYVLIHDGKIRSMKELLPILEQVAKQGRPLLIVAEGVEGEALAILVINKLRGTLQIAAVNAPGFGERRKAILEDIGVLTGSKCVTAELGIKLAKIKVEQLGTAKHIIIDQETTTIVEAAGRASDIQARANQIRLEVEESADDYDREKLMERLAKLAGGVAVINVGAATETELQEKKARVQAALQATRAAVEEGVVPGGGIALIRAQKTLDALNLQGDEALGLDIVRHAVEAPLRQLLHNAGQESDPVVQEVKKLQNNEGFNIVTGKYVDLIKAGVIDPAKVTRSALQNAASLSGLLLTHALVVTDSPETMTTTWHPKGGDRLEMKLHHEARGRLLRGVERTAQGMKSKLGRNGRFVGLDKKFGAPLLKTDAGTSFGNAALGSYENMGAQVVHVLAATRSAPHGSDDSLPPGAVTPPTTPGPPDEPPPDPGTPGTTLTPQRYLVARAVERVAVGVPFTLTARISNEDPSSAPGQAGSAVTGDVSGKLKISIHAAGFTANDGTQREIDVPITGNSPWAPFELVATKPGIYPIDVLAWKNSVQVGGVTISIGVGSVQAGEASARSEINAREPEQGEYTLEVVFERALSKYRFQLRSDTGDNWPAMFSDLLEGTRSASYAQLITNLNTQARNLNQLTELAQDMWLKGMGGGLYKTLVPPELKEALWENRDKIKYLNILSAVEPMPWELLYLSSPAGTANGGFIADTATVTRWRYGPPAGRQISKKNPYFVLPNGSPTKAQDEVSYVTEKLGAGSKSKIDKLDDLLSLLTAGDFSLLHFASHNVADPNAIAGLYIPFGSSKFDITFMGSWTTNQFRSQRPLVFMNSCTSGGAVPLYTDMAGWADSFLGAGCGAFIGALWEIRDTSASIFAKTFYDEVTAGKNLGESMRTARSALKSSDPTHLAYTLYGNPLATFS
jgi:chaperonin GroEL